MGLQDLHSCCQCSPQSFQHLHTSVLMTAQSNLAGMEILTDLRRLSLRYSRHFHVPQWLHSGNIKTLAAALPLQPQLTALELHGQFCNAAVLAAAGASRALQSSRLAGRICTPACAS